MDLAKVIIDLSNASGPSGFETPVAEMACKLMAPYVDETYIDVMGNAIGVKRCGIENAPKVLLDAHLDEIGFIITYIEKDGFLKYSTIGGVDPRMMPAACVKLLTEPPIYGVIDTMPPHALSAEDAEKSLGQDELAIDVGLSEEECRNKIPLGTPAVYAAECVRFGSDMICGKALDDRACFAILVKAAELLSEEKLNCDVYIMGSTQEEVGLRGAKTGAFALDPDYGIIVDVGHGKTPDSADEVHHTVGGGAMIAIGPNMNRELTNTAIERAKEKGIKYQIEVEADGDSGTNTTVVQVTREGVATALFSLPLKYMHTPREVISLSDAEAIAALIAETVKTIGEEK